MQVSIRADMANINFRPTTMEEIIQNISMIIGTLKGTIPLDRNFGLSNTFLDKPTPIAKTKFIAEVYEAVATYEPRATIKEIIFAESETPGRLCPVVEVVI